MTMKEIVLSGARWQTRDDFYQAFLHAVGAPAWHGRNLDALYDSIGSGDINEVETPYRVRITGVSAMSPEALEMVKHFESIVKQMRDEGVDVSVEREP